MHTAFTHIALQVKDVAASVAFYRDYCGMVLTHDRTAPDGTRVVWLAEPGRETEFVIVLLPGGKARPPAEDDLSHFGFELETREAVDAVAARAEAAGLLAWPPREEPPPVGYYCGVRDPDGHFVEFSHGQEVRAPGPGRQAT